MLMVFVRRGGIGRIVVFSIRVLPLITLLIFASIIIADIAFTRVAPSSSATHAPASATAPAFCTPATASHNSSDGDASDSYATQRTPPAAPAPAPASATVYTPTPAASAVVTPTFLLVCFRPNRLPHVPAHAPSILPIACFRPNRMLDISLPLIHAVAHFLPETLRRRFLLMRAAWLVRMPLRMT